MARLKARYSKLWGMLTIIYYVNILCSVSQSASTLYIIQWLGQILANTEVIYNVIYSIISRQNERSFIHHTYRSMNR
jgi:uncharacterized membrane protein